MTVNNVLHFCFELRVLKMTSRMKHLIAGFLSMGFNLSLISYRVRFFTVPILDFWGPYAKLCWNAFVRVSLRLESRSQKASLPLLGMLSTRCFFVFFSQTRDCTTFTLHDLTDFYIERVTAHHIKRNDHSCFHNSWPNSKTKHLWEQGGPLVFWGPYAACVFCV